MGLLNATCITPRSISYKRSDFPHLHNSTWLTGLRLHVTNVWTSHSKGLHEVHSLRNKVTYFITNWNIIKWMKQKLFLKSGKLTLWQIAIIVDWISPLICSRPLLCTRAIKKLSVVGLKGLSVSLRFSRVKVNWLFPIVHSVGPACSIYL